MQLKFDSFRMKCLDFEPGKRRILSDRCQFMSSSRPNTCSFMHKPREPAMALCAAPMVLSKHRERRVSHRKLSLRQISADKILSFPGQRLLAKQFANEQQSAAAIEEQSRRFRERNFSRLEMLITSSEKRFFAKNDSVGR